MPARHLLALLATLALACAPEPPPGAAVPLVDGLHAPQVLTESDRLEPPPSTSGNRFLTGWRPWRREGTTWQINDGELSLLEVASLEPRQRLLVLSLEIGEAAPGATVAVRVAGRELPPVQLAPRLELPLPGDLPLGRQTITLDFGGARLAVEKAQVGDVQRPGRVEFGDGAILQGGTSAIDFPRRLTAPATLVGRFEPPRGAAPEQRFTVVLETEDGASGEVFAWSPGPLARFAGARSLRVPVPAGIVRLRLLAQGAGPAGRWRGLGLVAPGGPAAADPPAQKSAPQPPRLLLLYVMDALRADAVGHLGGDPAASPVLDRLATEGVTFSRYYSLSPDTVGATKALLGGFPVLTREARAAKLEAGEVDTLGGLFSAAGFRTGLFTGQPNVPSYGAAAGFQESRFRWLEDQRAINRNAELVQGDFLEWLDGLGTGERVFALLQTIHPHNPYTPPEPFQSRFTAGIPSKINGWTETLLDVHHRRRQVTAADRERLAALYRANLAYNDHQLGLLVDELQRRYEPGEVLLILTSDHGEELFDHGGLLHGFTLYEEQLHIPLVIWWPGQLEPLRVERLADNLDLHATLRALAGQTGPGRAGGENLWPAIFGAASADDGDGIHMAAAAGIEGGGLYMAASARYKLVLAPRGGMGVAGARTTDPEYVFDLVDDPRERRNLAGSQALEVEWLRARLEAWVERTRLEEAGGEPAELDEETRERLRALGYLD